MFISKLHLVFILMFSLFSPAQNSTEQNFYAEFHLGVKYNFGPTETQAEIIGGYDTLSYDHRNHYNPGYKTSVPIELVIGYSFDRLFKIESTFSYYKLDIGLVQTLNRSEYPLLLADMLSVKASGLLCFTEITNDSSIQLYSGISMGAVFPFSKQFNEVTKNNYGINDFHSRTQLFFEINAFGSLALNNNGLYLSAGASFTLPWLIGSIGQIEMQSGSQYSAVRDKVMLHSISGFLGIGYRF